MIFEDGNETYTLGGNTSKLRNCIDLSWRIDICGVEMQNFRGIMLQCNCKI